MIVDDLDVFGACKGPAETDSELVVDPDTMLSGSITLQCLKTITWWHSKVLQKTCDLQLTQLTACRGFYVYEASGPTSLSECLSICTSEGTINNSNAMRY